MIVDESGVCLRRVFAFNEASVRLTFRTSAQYNTTFYAGFRATFFLTAGTLLQWNCAAVSAFKRILSNIVSGRRMQ